MEIRSMGSVKPVNRARRSKTFARNFGARGDVVRRMGCAVARRDDPVFITMPMPMTMTITPAMPCSGNVHAAHTIPRGMGGAHGDRRALVGLCARHHEEAGERGTSKRRAFDETYGDGEGWLEREAERIAAELDALGVDMPDDFEDIHDGDGHGYEVLSLDLGVHERVTGWATKEEARTAAWARWAELKARASS